MNNIKIENEIIALIPSNTIKNAVMELKHKFSEIELVQIITEFAPSWVEMIDLLSDLKKYVEDDIGLDACTVRSNKINVLVLSEGEL